MMRFELGLEQPDPSRAWKSALTIAAAYVVGGAVRDVIAGRSPVDWDLATDATPDALRAHFPDARYENRFGTVGIPASGGAVREVTTFRVDGPSSDARRPDEIQFIGDLRGDLDRRDFTINAIAFGLGRGEGAEASDPVANGALVDPHGGAADLVANILRAVGDPDARFREDALRMLRAARFAARFNLTIDPLTAAAIRRDASLAASLSGERVGAEIEGILAAAHPAVGVALLHELAGKKNGRATIVAERRSFTEVFAEVPAGATRFLDVVSRKKDDDALVRALLGDALLVENDDAALALRAGGETRTLVTRGGFVFDHDGTIRANERHDVSGRRQGHGGLVTAADRRALPDLHRDGRTRTDPDAAVARRVRDLAGG
jgi:hypothetical protein